MRQPRRTMSRLCQCLATAFVFCQGPANAATVGVMADESTGRLHPAAVEERMAGLSAEVELASGDSVTVPGIVQAVYSDSEANKAEVALLNQYFPTNRVEFENWGRGAHGTTYTSNNMLLEDGRLDKLAAGVAMFTTSNGTVWVDSVEVRTNAGFVVAIVDFHPDLPEGQVIRFDSIRPAVLDQYGLHYGTATGEAGAFEQIFSPAYNALPALATADGTTVFLAWSGNGLFRSRDGATSWQKLAKSVSSDAALATAGGNTLFLAVAGDGLYRSRDGGDTFEKLSQSVGASPALACGGGAVFLAVARDGLYRSRDGGDTFEKLSQSVGASPALATADGITLFLGWQYSGIYKSTDSGENFSLITDAPEPYRLALAMPDGVSVWLAGRYPDGVWRSPDCGETWPQVQGAPVPGNSCGMAAVGGTTFIAWQGDGLYKASPLFGSSADTPYTVILQATAGNAVQLKDFEAARSGSGSIYWTLETAPDEWSIWGARESPLQWHTIAKKTNNVWYARTSTNGLEATSARDAPSAITIALASNAANRIVSSAYSPYYGYSAFEGGIPVRWAATFWPDTNSVTTNAPGISGIYTLSSQFSDSLHWATPDFRIDLTATNPVTSTVTWPEDFTTRAAIFYHPKREEEE